jgi:DNA-binding IclR family transcriptional regulator
VPAAVPEGGSTVQLAEQVEVSISTAKRCLRTLAALGLLDQPGPVRRFGRTSASLADCRAELP